MKRFDLDLYFLGKKIGHILSKEFPELDPNQIESFEFILGFKEGQQELKNKIKQIRRHHE